MIRKVLTGVASLLALLALAGCGSASAQTPSNAAGNDFDPARMINVISREDGSGTRGAFIELFGIQEKRDDGTKTDNTTKEAAIAKATDVMMTTVAGDEYAIGYISLGSLNDSVKALQIDGADATAENVASGTYKIARPFNIATKGEPSGLAKDFIDYIMSAEGQQIVQDNGYIAVVTDAAPFSGTKPAGKLTVAGSSSVNPVMEKLAEGYQALNASATIELQQSDSTAGMTAAMDGTCDIGMASRELKDEELTALTATAIANDGIAVIVSPKNPTTSLTSADIKAIYTGAVTTWDGIQ